MLLFGLLSAASSGHALNLTGPWVGSNILRWTPPTLINPVEPGTQFDAAFPGRGLRRKPVSTGFDNISGADTADLLVTTPANGAGAGNGFPDGAVTPRIGRIQFEGWRRWRAIAADLSVASTGAGVIIKYGPRSESGYLEGIRADFVNGPETDACGITGPTTGNYPDTYLQNCSFKNVHGTNLQHDEGRAISSASVFGGVMTINADTSVPTVLTVGQDIIVGGMSDPTFNSTWTIQSLGSGMMVATANHGIPLPANGASATGGTLWALNAAALGIHADIVQGYGAGRLGNLYLHRVSGTGNYDFLVVGQRLDTGYGVSYSYVSYCDYAHVDIDPQDYGGFAILAGDYDTPTGTVPQRGARKAAMQLFQTYAVGRTSDDFLNAVIPQQGRYVGGLPFGMRPEVYQGYDVASYPANPISSITGVIANGSPPGGPWAPYAALGAAYVSPGYAGKSAVAPAITDIIVTSPTGGALTYKADDPRGTIIGIIDVPYEAGWIIDVILTDDAGRKLEVASTAVQRGIAFYNGGTFNFTLTANVRGTSVTFSKSLSVTCAAAVAPSYSTMSDADAVAFVRSLYGYSLMSPADLAFYNGYFIAAKALDGGAVWPLLTRKTTSAMLDERDSGLNWFDPADLELLPYYQPKAWTASEGYAGDPVAGFHLTRAGFTPTQAGMLQNSCAMLAGLSIKAPGVAPGTLPAGTEYVAGNNNVTADGFGGVFLGVTATGQVSCKCANDATKNTPATPFSGTDGSMRYLGVSRTGAAGFVIFYGAKGAPLTVDTTTAASGASSASHPLSVVDMRMNGRGPSNPGSRTVNFAIWAQGLTSAQMDLLRGLEDTWLDYIGIA